MAATGCEFKVNNDGVTSASTGT